MCIRIFPKRQLYRQIYKQIDIQIDNRIQISQKYISIIQGNRLIDMQIDILIYRQKDTKRDRYMDG